MVSPSRVPEVRAAYSRIYAATHPASVKRHQETAHARRVINRNWLTALKLRHGCAVCGYRGHPAALDFNHYKGEKKLDLCAMVKRGYSIQTLREEIAKCVILCSNHHREWTIEGVING
jgi:hypothetical protein